MLGKRFSKTHPTLSRANPENPDLSRLSLFLYLNSHQQGQAVTSVRQAQPGDALRATLADGAVDVTVVQPRLL